jgi:hypothetical protein
MKTLDGPQSGARGDIVASRNRSGQFQRKRVSPRNPRTAAQRRIRGDMCRFSHLWSQITEPQRVAWHAVAHTVPSRPKLGKPRPLDGQKLFNKINTVLATCGREPLLEPPSRPQFGPNPVVALTASNDRGGIALKLSISQPPAEDIMVFASPPCSAGRSYCSNFSFLCLLPAPAECLNDLTRLYLKKLNEWKKLKRYRGVALPGSRIFIRTWQQWNGWENKAFMRTTSVVIPAREFGATSQKGRWADGKAR